MLLWKKVMESLRLTSPYPLNKEEPVCMLGNVKFSLIYWFHVMIVVVYQFKSIKYRRANHLYFQVHSCWANRLLGKTSGYQHKQRKLGVTYRLSVHV